MNWKVIILLACWPSWLAASSPPGGIQFLNLRLPEARERAAQLDMPLLVHFTASWCMPCQWMEQNTFMDAALIQYMNTHFLAVKVDIDDEAGSREMDNYDVTNLPTILVFSPEGQILMRQEKSITSERLLESLQKFGKLSKTLVTEAAPAGAVAPTAYMEHLSKPALIPDTYSTSTSTSVASTYPRETPNSNWGDRPPVVGAVRTGALPASYYVIQVGAFSDYQRASLAKQEAEVKYRMAARILEEVQPGKPTMFKIHLGVFTLEAEAVVFLRQLERDGNRGFVVQVNKL